MTEHIDDQTNTSSGTTRASDLTERDERQVVAFIADFGRHPMSDAEPVCQTVRLEGLDAFFQRLGCELLFAVENRLTGEGLLSVDLTLASTKDLDAASIARQVPALRILDDAARQLRVLHEVPSVWALVDVARTSPDADVAQWLSRLPFDQRVLLSLHRAEIEPSMWTELLEAVSAVVRLDVPIDQFAEIVASLEKNSAGQLQVILEHPKLQTIAMSWRRLQYLVAAAGRRSNLIDILAVNSSKAVGVRGAVDTLRTFEAIDCVIVDESVDSETRTSLRSRLRNVRTVVYLDAATLDSSDLPRGSLWGANLLPHLVKAKPFHSPSTL